MSIKTLLYWLGGARAFVEDYFLYPLGLDWLLLSFLIITVFLVFFAIKYLKRDPIKAAEPKASKAYSGDDEELGFQIVITIHGVESIGQWQDQIHPEFGGIDDFVHIPHNYGRFPFWKAGLPFCRRREILRFYTKYSAIRDQYPGINPSIVAHSFGTYIIAQSLLMYPYMEFDRLILCGSVIACDYDWRSLLKKKRIRRIRNEVAGSDSVVRLFRWQLMRQVIPGTGPSGIDKFLGVIVKLEQPVFQLFTHRDHFVANEHCRKSWIPFLRGTEDFMSLCKRCLSGGTDAQKALAEFDQEYADLIHLYVEKLFRSRFSTTRQVSDYCKIIRKDVIEQGARGKRNAERLIQRETLALLKVINR